MPVPPGREEAATAPGPSPEMPRNKLWETGFVSGWEIGPSMAMPTRPWPRRTNSGQTTLAPQFPHLLHRLGVTKLTGLICKASEKGAEQKFPGSVVRDRAPGHCPSDNGSAPKRHEAKPAQKTNRTLSIHCSPKNTKEKLCEQRIQSSRHAPGKLLSERGQGCSLSMKFGPWSLGRWKSRVSWRPP